MNKKVITAALTGVLTTGMVAPAMANTTKDAATIYRNAYDATMKAKDFKSEDVNEVQTVILEARSAIKELKVLATEKDNKEWLGNVNDWSTIVDGVQQPILSKIIKVVEPMNKKLEAGEAVSQEEINAAVALIPTDLPLVWKNDYTSITDKAQTKLVDEAFAALKKAEAEKTAALVKEAQAKIDVIKKSTKTAVIKQAEVFQGRLDAIKLYDLNVTKVTNITKTNIIIEFEALKEAIKDVTIEVIDSEGKVYEVKAQRVIDEGEKEAKFTFVNELKELPTGEWTVNGVKYDAQEVRTVEKVQKAVTDNNQKDLLAALNTKYFKNVDEDLIVSYKNNMKDALDNNKLGTIAEIQKVIDDTNSGTDKNAFVPAIVKAAKEGNQIKLQAALEKAPLNRVNYDWVKAYMEKIELLDENSSFDTVQSKIDEINKDEIEAAYNTAETSVKLAEINKAEDYIVKYANPQTEDDKKDIEEGLKTLELRRAIIDVVTSETKGELRNSFARLAKLDKEVAKAPINDYLMDNYVKAIVEAADKDNVSSITTINQITTLIETVNSTQETEAVGKVKEKATALNGATDKDKAKATTEFKASLEHLSKVVNDIEKLDLKEINDTVIESYAKAMTSVTTTTEVKNAITTVNGSIVTELVKDLSTKTSAQVLEVLNNKALGLSNVITDNGEEYKTDAAEIEKATTAKEVQEAVKKINVRVEIKNAKTVSGVESSLIQYRNLTNNEELVNAGSLGIKDIAQEMFKAKTNTISNIAALDTAVTTACGVVSTNITAVNDAETNKEVIDAIAKLDITINADQAEKFNANRPKDKDGQNVDFKNYTEIRNVLNK